MPVVRSGHLWKLQSGILFEAWYPKRPVVELLNCLIIKVANSWNTFQCNFCLWPLLLVMGERNSKVCFKVNTIVAKIKFVHTCSKSLWETSCVRFASTGLSTCIFVKMKMSAIMQQGLTPSTYSTIKRGLICAWQHVLSYSRNVAHAFFICEDTDTLMTLKYLYSYHKALFLIPKTIGNRSYQPTNMIADNGLYRCNHQLLFVSLTVNIPCGIGNYLSDFRHSVTFIICWSTLSV